MITHHLGRRAPEDLHDVRENARKLAVLYSVEVELARVIGSWIARTPELPEKLLLARVLYEDADHARILGQRLLELRVPAERLETLRQRGAPVFRQLEALDSAATFVACLFFGIKPALIGDYRRHLNAAPPYVDEPSVRWLNQVLREEEDHLAAGSALLAERQQTLADVPPLAGMWRLDVESGDLIEGEFVGKTPLPLATPLWPAVVQKLDGDEAMPVYPVEFDAAMRRCIHDLVFSETEALDIFGRYVYDFAQVPWQFSFEAARIAWDEARHVELLLNVLERYGGKLGEFPAKAPGYEAYVRQPSLLEKLIMVNVIAEGEVSTDTQTQHREAFRQLGDDLSALLKDYEMADEVSHGQFGLKWSRWVADKTGTSYAEAAARARRSLEEFKASHDSEGGQSPIPLVRLGVDETGDNRIVNVSAKRLVGFSEEEIATLAATAKDTVEDTGI